MVIPVSTIPAVKDYLLAQLQLALPGPDLGVYYGAPDPGYPDDFIVIGDTEQTLTPVQMVGSGGAGWLFESYHQDIEVSVFRGGDTPKVVFERAAQIVAQIETVVRGDPSLGGNVTVAYPAGTHYQSDWEADHKGWVTEAHMRVFVEVSRL